jgi:plastocyanin
VVVLFFAAGCGSNSAKQHVSSYAMTHPKIVPNPAKSHNPDSFYVPDPIRVHVGQTITWTNKDTDPHDVTSDNGVFFSGPMADGATFRWKPVRPGTYRYFCTIHPEMQGTIIVSR